MEKSFPFSVQLRYEREQHGWSQADLASRVGSEPKTVVRWENGQSLPRPYHRQVLCELFGKTVEEFGLLSVPLERLSAAPAEAKHSPLLPPTEPSETLSSFSHLTEKAYHSIVGFPPPTSSRTIQQREEAVQSIYAKLLQAESTAVVLTGIGGVGKSTLAALVSRYAEEQRRSGKGPLQAEALWLTVNESVTMIDLMGTIFEALGRPAFDWSSLTPQNQAVALFHALNTVEKTRLVILDQFENLLNWQTGYALPDRPGVGEWLDAINSQPCQCHILLTSRLWPRGTREYPATCLQEYQVAGLDLAEGVDLLRKQGVQASEHELQKAVEHCGGHAFALTLLASLIRNHQIGLSDLFAQPLYTRLWTGNVARNLLDRIYMQQLTSTQRNILVALSIFREPMPLDAAYALLVSSTEIGTFPPEDVEALLSHCLLQASGSGRYQLHAIVASYVRTHHDESSEQANEQALREAHVRAARYYQQRALSHYPPREERRRMKDVQPLVEAVWHYCQAEQWEEAYGLMERENFFDNLRNWGGNAVLLELCLLLQQASDGWSPEPLQQALIASSLGWAYGALGQGKQAKAEYERALKIYQERGDRKGESQVLNRLGWGYLVLGQMRKALAYYELALKLCEEIGDYKGEAFNRNCLGWVYSSLGEKQRAWEYCQQALCICVECEDRRGKGRALHSLGRISIDRGQYIQGLNYLDEALHIRSELGQHRGEGTVLSHKGRAYRKLKQYEQALDCLGQALSIGQEIGDRGVESYALHHQGMLYADIGQYKHAQELLERALSIRSELEDRYEQGRTINGLGRVYQALGKEEQAWECYNQALSIGREVEDPWGEGTAWDSLGRLLAKKARSRTALACLLLAEQCFEKAQSPELPEVHILLEDLRAKLGGEDMSSPLEQLTLPLPFPHSPECEAKSSDAEK